MRKSYHILYFDIFQIHNDSPRIQSLSHDVARNIQLDMAPTLIGLEQLNQFNLNILRYILRLRNTYLKQKYRTTKTDQTIMI